MTNGTATAVLQLFTLVEPELPDAIYYDEGGSALRKDFNFSEKARRRFRDFYNFTARLLLKAFSLKTPEP